jgi:hypothetical protein
VRSAIAFSYVPQSFPTPNSIVNFADPTKLSLMRTLGATILLFLTLNANATLSIKLDKPKTTGNKTVVQLTLRNTFTEKIDGARATLFLIGEQDKVIGQRTDWVIGGERDRPPLKPDATTTYNFVIDTDKPVSTTRLIFSRIILENGKLADPKKDVKLE